MSYEPEDLLLPYLQGTYPIRWAAWLGRLPDGKAKLQLSSILFDENESLRDLTDPTIRRQVVELVFDDSSLRDLVLSEIASALSDQSCDDDANDPGPGEDSGEWKLVSSDQMKLEHYPCGIRAGDILQLRADLHIQDHNGQPTGTVYPAGEEIVVLFGNPDEPDVIWLRHSNGEQHTWGETILDTFEPTGRRAPGFPA
jgi:hypothetical protein